MTSSNHGDVFERSRGRLVALAYRLVGTVADAEDAVQDAALGWSRTDASTVNNPEAYLVTATTHAALNRLRSRRSETVSYPGVWLPEPIATHTIPESVRPRRTPPPRCHQSIPGRLQLRASRRPPRNPRAGRNVRGFFRG